MGSPPWLSPTWRTPRFNPRTQVNGPFGNFNPRQYRVKLIDDMTSARRLWLSEDRDLGFCKGSSSGYIQHLMDGATHPGTGSGLIVADGKVFASSFRPNGAVWPEKHPSIGPAAVNEKFTAQQRGTLRRNNAYEADDFTIAVDFASGKTLWKTIERGQGINRYSGKHNHFMATPVYHDGKAFSLGTMGSLILLRRPDWQEAVGRSHQPPCP